MEEWKKIKISDIGRIVTGKTPRTSIKENYGGYIPFLTPSDDLSNKFAPITNKVLTDKGLMEVRNCLLPENSICVSCIGSDLGKVVMLKKPTVTNQQFNSIIPNENYSPDFVYYLMIIVGKRLNFLSKTSTAVPIINKSTFSNFEVEVPSSLRNQTQIAKILSSLDDKIELNNRINANLEEQAQVLFRRWFVDFEFPNEQGLPYKSNGGRLVQSEHGSIPEGWNFNQLNYFGKIVCGKTPSKSIEDYFGGNIPFIKIPDMHNNIFVINSEDSLSSCGERSQSNKTIPPYSILVSCIATVGLVCINTKKSQFNQQINAIIPFHESFRYYIYLKLKTMYNKLQLLASGGSATLNLNTGQFSAIKIENPNKKLIIDFHKITTPFFKEIELRQNENIYLTQLRDSLLPKLMNNEIEIH